MRRLLVVWLVLMLAACEKPASPRPEWEVRYEAARKEADAAFAANQSFKAAEMYRVALGALPQSDPRRDECNQKIATCTFLDLREKGLQFLSQDKTEEALMAFEKAVTLLPKDDPRIPEAQRAIDTLKFKEKSKAGRDKLAKGSWLDAAKDFAAAREFAPEAQAAEMKDLEAFSERFAEADDAFLVKKDYAKAQLIYEELMKNPRGTEKILGERLSGLREAGKAAKVMEEEQFKSAFEKGQALFAQCEWAKAKEALDAAAATGVSTPEFDLFLKKARAAANPPEGFAYVAAGKFRFGAGGADLATGPEQDVDTEAFYISRREITCGQYRKFLEAYKDHSKCFDGEPDEKKARGHTPEDWSDKLDPEQAVTGVDWFDAFAYARWAGGKLPSEVEWEKAASWIPCPGKKNVYPWGDEYATGDGPSPCGAEAMGSGVIEWVADWYKPYDGSKATDVEFGEKRRAARGGVFLKDSALQDAKVTQRFWFLPDRRGPSLGFRIVLPTS